MAVTLEGQARVEIEAARELNPTEERILVAALGLIGRRGVRRLGMQEVAEAAGVSRGTLYRYFPSKEHVLTAAAAYDERRFSDGVDLALAAARSPEERIGDFVAYAFDFIRSHPARSLFESEPGFVLSFPPRPPSSAPRRVGGASGRRPRHRARRGPRRPRP